VKLLRSPYVILNICKFAKLVKHFAYKYHLTMPNIIDDSTEYAPITMLRERLTADCNQAALADQIGISPQYLSEILREKRPPSEQVLDFLKLERVVTYRPKSDGVEPKSVKKSRSRRR